MSASGIQRSASTLLLPGYRPCDHCAAVLPPGKIQCPECRGWNATRAKRRAALPTEDDAPFFRLSDVVRSEAERLSLGPLLDPLLNGGLPLSTTLLLSGQAGACKTTLMLQSVDYVVAALDKRPTTAGRSVLYIAGEQSGDELAMIAERIELVQSERLIVAPGRGGAFDLDGILDDVEPGFVIVDSLQGLLGPVNQAADAILLCQRLKDYAIERLCPAIILSHVNKDRVAAGAYSIQHEVDATMLALIGAGEAKGEPVDDVARTLIVTKNRYGTAPMKAVYTMTARGLAPPSDDAR